jgi:hypothetical protein
MKPPALKSLQDLKAVKRDIEARAKLEKEQEAARVAAAAKARAEKELFSRAVGPVKALPAKHLPATRPHYRRRKPRPSRCSSSVTNWR